MATFAQIYAEVGNLTPSTGVARDKLFVNQAYHDILSRRRWSFLESTGSITLVAGTRGYVTQGTTPSLTDCDGVFDVSMVMTTAQASVRLAYVTPQMHSRLFSHVFTNTQPSTWTTLGGAAATSSATVVSGGQQQLTLNYPPAAVAGSGVTLTCKFWRSAASIEMSADADVPIIPVQYHNLITTRALAIAMNRYSLFSDAQGHQRDFEEMLQAADIADGANRFSDFEQIEMRTLPQLDNRVGQTPNTYNPGAVPYPQAQS